MNIARFANESGKTMSTVKQWFLKGIVPGVKLIDNKWVISDLAMPPYTSGRPHKENATSVRKSIIKAALKHQSTCARLFGLPDQVFNLYVEDLENRGLIRVLTDPLFPGDKFILTTLKTDEYLQDRGILGKDGLLTTITSKAIEAAVSELIKQNMGKNVT